MVAGKLPRRGKEEGNNSSNEGCSRGFGLLADDGGKKQRRIQGRKRVVAASGKGAATLLVWVEKKAIASTTVTMWAVGGDGEEQWWQCYCVWQPAADGSGDSNGRGGGDGKGGTTTSGSNESCGRGRRYNCMATVSAFGAAKVAATGSSGVTAATPMVGEEEGPARGGYGGWEEKEEGNDEGLAIAGCALLRVGRR
ncbi:hypothetical protein GW17_00041564 [Ensete ventricosum]|nr:hypothetical protein GW17_00041564 [Ensete ventricosum]